MEAVLNEVGQQRICFQILEIDFKHQFPIGIIATWTVRRFQTKANMNHLNTALSPIPSY